MKYRSSRNAPFEAQLRLAMVVIVVILSLFVFKSQSETIKNGDSMENRSTNWTEKYSKLFLGFWAFHDEKKYLNPHISLESRGTTLWTEGIELVQVINYPPPPSDPQPYDLWVIVHGKSIFKPSSFCEIFHSLNRIPNNRNEALSLAQTLIYLKSVRPYYLENMMVNPTIKENDGVWTIEQNTTPFSAEPRFKPSYPFAKYKVQLGKSVCKVEGGD